MKLLSDRQAIERAIYDKAHAQYAEETATITAEIHRLRDIVYAGGWLEEPAKTFLRE